MKITIPTEPSRYDHRKNHFESKHVITLNRGNRWHRFGLGGWNANGKGRLEQDGPEVKGPVAYAFGLAGVIDNNGGTGAERRRNLEGGTEHDVNDGDVLVLDGVEYTVKVFRNEYINLVPVQQYERRKFRVLAEMREAQALEAEGGWEKEWETTAEVQYRRAK